MKDVILPVVRWYLSYSLSYRDIEEMMLERGTKQLLIFASDELEIMSNFIKALPDGES